MFKKFLVWLVIFCAVCSTAYAKDIDSIEAASYVLMDGTSGAVLLEKNSDLKLPPASITKIMTMLLTLEAAEKGEISLDDIVTVSETAAHHEGSHVFLEIGEQISVRDLLKAVAVASGNDAAIALSEHVAGNQSAFVDKMNVRAQELGMSNTLFINCNGLDAENHLSTAMDIAKMTYEITKHPEIFNYTSIWMDSLRDGKFQLSNTNKLIRFYDGATGMKTGFTSKAGYCLSATATRNDVSLIAVVMQSPTSTGRFGDASTLLNYGFESFVTVKAGERGQILSEILVENGEKEQVNLILANDVKITLPTAEKESLAEEVSIPKILKAPISTDKSVGKVVYKSNGRVVGEAELFPMEESKKITMQFLIKNIFNTILTKI